MMSQRLMELLDFYIGRYGLPGKVEVKKPEVKKQEVKKQEEARHFNRLVLVNGVEEWWS